VVLDNVSLAGDLVGDSVEGLGIGVAEKKRFVDKDPVREKDRVGGCLEGLGVGVAEKVCFVEKLCVGENLRVGVRMGEGEWAKEEFLRVVVSEAGNFEDDGVNDGLLLAGMAD